MNKQQNERDAGWNEFIELYCKGCDIPDRSDWIPFKVGFDAGAASVDRVEIVEEILTAMSKTATKECVRFVRVELETTLIEMEKGK